MYEINENLLKHISAGEASTTYWDTLKNPMMVSGIAMVMARPFGLSGIVAFGTLGFLVGVGYDLALS